MGQRSLAAGFNLLGCAGSERPWRRAAPVLRVHRSLTRLCLQVLMNQELQPAFLKSLLS